MDVILDVVLLLYSWASLSFMYSSIVWGLVELDGDAVVVDLEGDLDGDAE